MPIAISLLSAKLDTKSCRDANKTETGPEMQTKGDASKLNQGRYKIWQEKHSNHEQSTVSDLSTPNETKTNNTSQGARRLKQKISGLKKRNARPPTSKNTYN
jgi:hypothetical protein